MQLKVVRTIMAGNRHPKRLNARTVTHLPVGTGGEEEASRVRLCSEGSDFLRQGTGFCSAFESYSPGFVKWGNLSPSTGE